MRKSLLFVVPNLRLSNGVTSVIMNHYDELIKNGYYVDFLLLSSFDSPYFEKIQDNKGNIYIMPDVNRKVSHVNIKFCLELFKQNNYSIIHVNTTGPFACIALWSALVSNVKIRIYHAHNPKETTSFKSKIRSNIFDPLCVKFANNYLACSKSAGESIFKRRQFKILTNAIDVKKYGFNIDLRNSIRRKLNIQDDFVIGTVCRQAEQKNPYFLVDIFAQLNNIRSNTKLLWIGTGPLMESVIQYCNKIGISEKVIFMGDQSDVNELYSAMDVFLLPSLYEGLGLVFVEAQANGLICFASDRVPSDVKITSNIYYLSLEYSANEWSKKIHLTADIPHERLEAKKKAFDSPYNLSTHRGQLLQYYNSIL
ncbi:glycosyltransferase [Bacillus sp. AFS029533]|uniref:glycosyltransferase n=1 Tax=Bacillus sp. AFS029533 TaxID=2033494 RepID=UPI000BFC2826|nr:glycosyltransferase [Bacillus sp. AFS029533]PGZ91712.1 hypothetical protein COE53_13635 [Bacillus sp. AFS029533]